VRNWVKSGQLLKLDVGGRILFSNQHIQEVTARLAEGGIERLLARANKKASQTTFVPDEYCTSGAVAALVNTLVKRYRESQTEIRTFLFSIVRRLLRNRPLSASLQEEYVWWEASAGAESPRDIDIELPRHQPDFLGLVYQSILAEGAKAEAGAYYTPAAIARSMVRDHLSGDSAFLDPCCGTGLFLLQAADVLSDPTKIWGFDIDETAVRIARLNLLLRFDGHTFKPNIFCQCGLEPTTVKFDVIATNPPWGMHFSNDELNRFRRLYKTQSNESFALFILACIRCLKANGSMSLLLPQSFLNIRTHQETRRMLVEETSIRSVSDLGRIFKNVFTPVVRFDIDKSCPSASHSITTLSGGNARKVPQDRFKENAGYIFDIVNSEDDRELLDILYNRNYMTLKGQADWALGIVTGNNSKFLLQEKLPGAEPIWKGKDIRRFSAIEPTQFIRFTPDDFQQVAPESKYRAAEKLLYRFISNELVFSYDNNRTLALNSANILIPRLNGYSIKATAAFLNSSVFHFIFQRKFRALKVLRGDLERLPFPKLPSTLNLTLSALVDSIIDVNAPLSERKTAYVRLDSIIMDSFYLTESQRTWLVSEVRQSPAYLPFRP